MKTAIEVERIRAACDIAGHAFDAGITHLRVGEPVYMNVIIGFLIWVGLYLRRPRLRELVWSS